MDDIVITLKDLREFEQDKKNNRVKAIMAKVFAHAPKEIVAEYREKGVMLRENPLIPEDALAKYLQVLVPDSQESVQKYIEEYVPTLICLKDI